MKDERLQRLEEIEKWNNELKLSSDDHGHDCTSLREYCEIELGNASADFIPWLIAELKSEIGISQLTNGIIDRHGCAEPKDCGLHFLKYLLEQKRSFK